MKQHPFLSIIVPAYNVENYIKQCVDSILTQSFNNFELILVDDGSKDSTGRICDDYGAKDARVRVLHKENGGLVSARKAGITEAKGEYVAYVDGDDWIAPEMFENLCAVARRENVDIVISDFIISRENGQEPLTQNMARGCYDKKALREQIYPWMLCNGEYFSFGFQPSLCSKLFRRSLLLPRQLKMKENIKLGEDAACFYPSILDAGKVVYLKGGFYYFYRMRETSISHAIVKSFYTDEILTLINHLKECFVSHAELWTILQGQLWLYACYMFDNMITPCITFRNLFFNKTLKQEFCKIKDSPIGREMIKYCKSVRTSSRTKRIMRVIERNGLKEKVSLFLFIKYERLQKG